MTAGQALPELASVPWRQRTDERWLTRWGRIWQAWTLLYTVPFLAAGVGMLWLAPLAAPVALMAIAHAWIIPELYAFRGASVVRPKGPRNEGAEPVAQGLLGDLLGHEERELQRRTGLALERGELGVWLVGEAGALLVTPGGAAGALLLRAYVPSPSCRPPTAWPTCCWPCAWTRRALPPWPTTPSRVRRGGFAGACPSRCAPRWTRHAARRAGGERSHLSRGRLGRPARHLRAGGAHLGCLAHGAQPAARRPCTRPRGARGRMAARAAAARVHRSPGRRLFWICEDGGGGGRLHAGRRVSAPWTSSPSSGWRPRTRGGAWAGRCSSAAGPGRPRRDLGRVVLAAGNAGGPQPVHRVRGHAGERALAPAPARRGVSGAPVAGGRRERAGRARPDPRACRERMEAAGATGHRPRAAAASRLLRAHPDLPGHHGSRRRAGRWRSAG